MGNKRNKIAQQIHDASINLSKVVKETFTNPIEFGTGIEVPYEEWANDLRPALDKVTKLNEELTAENSRLLIELDKTKCQLQKQRDTWDEFYPLCVNSSEKLKHELSSIKSKWWYKLMTWGW